MKLLIEESQCALDIPLKGFIIEVNKKHRAWRCFLRDNYQQIIYEYLSKWICWAPSPYNNNMWVVPNYWYISVCNCWTYLTSGWGNAMFYVTRFTYEFIHIFSFHFLFDDSFESKWNFFLRTILWMPPVVKNWLLFIFYFCFKKIFIFVLVSAREILTRDHMFVSL